MVPADLQMRVCQSGAYGVARFLPEPALVPALERALELRADIADLERRFQRHILALESDDATPALRKRVMRRVTELEGVLAERGQAPPRLAANTPTLAIEPDRVAAALQALPILAERLGELPQDQMRVLLESLQFQTTYDPQERALMIEITLANSSQTHDDVSQVWSVHLTSQHANPGGLVGGPLAVAPTHARTRRALNSP